MIEEVGGMQSQPGSFVQQHPNVTPQNTPNQYPTNQNQQQFNPHRSFVQQQNSPSQYRPNTPTQNQLQFNVSPSNQPLPQQYPPNQPGSFVQRQSPPIKYQSNTPQSSSVRQPNPQQNQSFMRQNPPQSNVNSPNQQQYPPNQPSSFVQPLAMEQSHAIPPAPNGPVVASHQIYPLQLYPNLPLCQINFDSSEQGHFLRALMSRKQTDVPLGWPGRVSLKFPDEAVGIPLDQLLCVNTENCLHVNLDELARRSNDPKEITNFRKEIIDLMINASTIPGQKNVWHNKVKFLNHKIVSRVCQVIHGRLYQIIQNTGSRYDFAPLVPSRNEREYKNNYASKKKVLLKNLDILKGITEVKPQFLRDIEDEVLYHLNCNPSPDFRVENVLISKNLTILDEAYNALLRRYQNRWVLTNIGQIAKKYLTDPKADLRKERKEWYAWVDSIFLNNAIMASKKIKNNVRKKWNSNIRRVGTLQERKESLNEISLNKIYEEGNKALKDTRLSILNELKIVEQKVTRRNIKSRIKTLKKDVDISYKYYYFENFRIDKGCKIFVEIERFRLETIGILSNGNIENKREKLIKACKEAGGKINGIVKKVKEEAERVKKSVNLDKYMNKFESDVNKEKQILTYILNDALNQLNPMPVVSQNQQQQFSSYYQNQPKLNPMLVVNQNQQQQFSSYYQNQPNTQYKMKHVKKEEIVTNPRKRFMGKPYEVNSPPNSVYSNQAQVKRQQQGGNQQLKGGNRQPSNSVYLPRQQSVSQNSRAVKPKTQVKKQSVSQNSRAVKPKTQVKKSNQKKQPPKSKPKQPVNKKQPQSNQKKQPPKSKPKQPVNKKQPQSNQKKQPVKPKQQVNKKPRVNKKQPVKPKTQVKQPQPNQKKRPVKKMRA
jgi:hypothetical protein